LCKQRLDALPVAGRVALRASVAEANVQVAIGPEGDLSTVVVREWLVVGDEDPLARRAGALVIGCGGQLRDDGRTVAGAAVVHEEASVRGEVGMERDPEQA